MEVYAIVGVFTIVLIVEFLLSLICMWIFKGSEMLSIILLCILNAIIAAIIFFIKFFA